MAMWYLRGCLVLSVIWFFFQFFYSLTMEKWTWGCLWNVPFYFLYYRISSVKEKELCSFFNARLRRSVNRNGTRPSLPSRAQGKQLTNREMRTDILFWKKRLKLILLVDSIVECSFKQTHSWSLNHYLCWLVYALVKSGLGKIYVTETTPEIAPSHRARTHGTALNT